ncbi:Glucan 1,3-beta-glucosidase [Pseudolycoriella hygida]|uniref:Glucan 1,3-beta-glucosidase n=1 Tax=Pseudolycoriella hygida TaxID=35572 RepID=A0A9Q0S6X7_9DIPT|nr:Glucan 1,3-beta-glucosidase [Pseudolycoriella hygida]
MPDLDAPPYSHLKSTGLVLVRKDGKERDFVSFGNHIHFMMDLAIQPNSFLWMIGKETCASHKKLFITLGLALLICIVVGVTLGVIYGRKSNEEAEESDMWIHNVQHGISAFHSNPFGYNVYRNVMDFGCKGDGIADDTSCINTAISSGERCGFNCGSSTILPALIYFPSGRYLISSPIVMYYYSQLVGNVKDPPTIIASPEFQGSSLIDSNPPDWFINQNNFFRQVRNFVLDMTQTPITSETTGIHWQVAQATSLVNIHFIMSTASNTGHRGIFMENGSGGFMSDLKFVGGKFGMWVGNQQFLSINLSFDRCDTAIYMNWNWQWTFKNLEITNVNIGVDMSATSSPVQSNVGSILLLDSSIVNASTVVLLRNNYEPRVNDVSGTLLLDNVQINNVASVVQGTNGESLLTVTGQQTISSWGRGSVYNDDSGKGTFGSKNLPPTTKASNLLDAEGRYFQRSRPQYENLRSSDFVSVKAHGAQGNGIADDSNAVQAVINANVNNGKVVYFPSGTYVFFKTVKVPPGVRIAGEIWAVIMAGGTSTFQDANNPNPVLKIGEPGDVGDVEITDLMFGSKGAQPGAILVQWNIKQRSQGSAGMWDSHFRVGGTAGSNLKFADCPRGQSAVDHCNGVHTLLHVTSTGSGYFENVWAWTADHDLDDGVQQSQISIYTGRGVLIESLEGPVWMYGIQSEHNVLYQYQLMNAHNIFMTMIQSETPYWQPGPPAPMPYTPNPIFSDPTYGHCTPGDIKCPMSYAVRASNSSNIYIYGAGMYNFFSDYDQTCLHTEDCQTSMVELENVNNVHMYNINTKAAANMVVLDNTKVLALSAENVNGFCRTINAFLL